MRYELQSLRESLFHFELQRSVIAACVHTKVVSHVRRAAGQWYELARVVRVWNWIGWITKSVKERTSAVRSYVRIAKTDDASLIGVIGRPVTGKPVRALIPDVRHFHCHRGCQLVLDRCVPHIYGSRALHRRTNSRIRTVIRSAQWNRAVSTDSWERGRWRPSGRIQQVHGNVVIDVGRIDVMRADRLVNKDGKVLCHGVTEVRPEYSDVETATVADAYDSFWPQLIRDSHSRPERAEIASNAAV